MPSSTRLPATPANCNLHVAVGRFCRHYESGGPELELLWQHKQARTLSQLASMKFALEKMGAKLSNTFIEIKTFNK